MVSKQAIEVESVQQVQTRGSRWCRVFSLGTVVAVIATGATGCGSNSSDSSTGPSSSDGPIKMAGIWDYTGADAEAGIVVAKAAKAKVAEVNASGGINDRKIDLTDQDDASDPAKGVLEYRKARDGGAELIMGLSYTPVATTQCELAQKDHVLAFSNASTATALTDPFKQYCYANTPTADINAQEIVKLLTSMGKKRIALVSQSDGYGEQTVSALEKAVEAAGGGMEIVTKQTIAADATDATSQIGRVKSSGADAVVIGVLTPAATALIKAAYQQRLDVPMVSFGGAFTPTTAKLVQTSAPIEFYLSSPGTCPQSQYGIKCGQDAMKALRAKPGSTDVPGFALLSYYATGALLSAMQQAKSPAPDDVIAALSAAAPYQNDFTPPIKYTDADHRGIHEQFFEGYKDGKLYFFGNDIAKNTYTP
jgi:ABC-type branched-subunit amino acid transport system substrate-binding protein